MTLDWWLLVQECNVLSHYTVMMQWWCMIKEPFRKASTHLCYFPFWFEGGRVSLASCCINTSSFSWILGDGDAAFTALCNERMSTSSSACVTGAHTWGWECAASSTHSVKHLCICSFLDYFLLKAVWWVCTYTHTASSSSSSLSCFSPCAIQTQFWTESATNCIRPTAWINLEYIRKLGSIHLEFFFIFQSALFKNQYANYSLQSEN